MLSLFLPLWEHHLISKDLDSLLVVQKGCCQGYFCTKTLIGCESCLWWLCQQNLGRQNRAIWPHFPKDANSKESGPADSLEKGNMDTWHYKKSFSTVLGTRLCPLSPAGWCEGSPFLQPGAGSAPGEQRCPAQELRWGSPHLQRVCPCQRSLQTGLSLAPGWC